LGEIFLILKTRYAINCVVKFYSAAAFLPANLTTRAETRRPARRRVLGTFAGKRWRCRELVPSILKAVKKKISKLRCEKEHVYVLDNFLYWDILPDAISPIT
jgi:hypothetical protein